MSASSSSRIARPSRTIGWSSTSSTLALLPGGRSATAVAVVSAAVAGDAPAAAGVDRILLVLLLLLVPFDVSPAFFFAIGFTMLLRDCLLFDCMRLGCTRFWRRDRSI